MNTAKEKQQQVEQDESVRREDLHAAPDFEHILHVVRRLRSSGVPPQTRETSGHSRISANQGTLLKTESHDASSATQKEKK